MNIFTTYLIQPLANGLVIFYRLLGNNMGLAIIGFSIALALLIRPFTKKSLESMKKMREIQPQLDKLKKKYKNDRMKLTQAQSELYKQYGVNPGLGGCLPIILQLVVFYGLVEVFIQYLSNASVTKFNTILYSPLKFDAHEMINTKFLYLDLTKPDTFNIHGIPFAIPGLFLILAGVSQMISAKIASPYIEKEEQIAKKTKGEMDDAMVAMQSSMIYTLPLMTLLVGGRFPSGVAIYWVTFSIYQAFQQYRTTGLGGLKSWIKALRVIQSGNGNAKGNTKSSK
ncbi:MAG TPA: YidC/Oxa1 family membrane protein insertase [Patescibacteria group bacterium]|nr:YidC/Oxa1 family membrane protein insertase [Patescibacteria group bacterium]